MGFSFDPISWRGDEASWIFPLTWLSSVGPAAISSLSPSLLFLSSMMRVHGQQNQRQLLLPHPQIFIVFDFLINVDHSSY
jgi:hypothetical protein